MATINDGDYVFVEAAVFNGTDGKLTGSTLLQRAADSATG